MLVRCEVRASVANAVGPSTWLGTDEGFDRTGTGDRLDVARVDRLAAGRAGRVRVGDLPAVAVNEPQGWPVGRGVVVAPLDRKSVV